MIVGSTATATPREDGGWNIKGQKIYITFGDHDMAENIVHLVLARTPDAPAGTRGISLFLVPKTRVNADGSLGEDNHVRTVSIEHKLGINASPTCVLAYGEDGDSIGHLIGPEHGGMRAMFTMMNNARLNVGLQGVQIGERATQQALAFAAERVQSARAGGESRDPIAILDHPDVRRMLMDQKAFLEGARALTYWTAFQGDLQHKSPDEKVREKAGDYMALLTPVIKAYLTHMGFEKANQALQLHGGSGFTREWGLEQIVRDCRITLIYEGTNGVQALDLVGRKLASNGGRAVFSFFGEIDEFISSVEGSADMDPFVQGLSTLKGQLQEATTWLMQNGMTDFNNAGASSHDYLHLFGLTGLAFMWAKMAKVALDKKAEGDPFYDEKLTTGYYFVDRMVPDGAAHLAKVKTGAKSMMALPAEAF